MDNFLNLLFDLSFLDYIFLFFLVVNALLALNNGFVSSLLSFLKWVLALIAAKIFLPLLTPYSENIIQSKFAHDILFGSIIFFLTVFIIILISKGIKKTISWTGLGGVDKFFGFIFGFFKGYVYFVSIFTLINFIHPYKKWDYKPNVSISFEIIIWGQKFLEENLPKRYEYIEKSKENVDEITK